MKNKKGQTIYAEDIYFPVEFRCRVIQLVCPMFPPKVGKKFPFTPVVVMPVLMTGWVNGEVHIQWSHQSLS